MAVGSVLATATALTGIALSPLSPAGDAAASAPTITAVARLNSAVDPAFQPVVSGDGRWTLYLQSGRLWAHDAQGPALNKVLVSQTTGGTPFNLSNTSIDTDTTGRFVAFTGYVDLFNPASSRPGLSTYLRDRDTDNDGIFDEAGATSTIEIGTRLANSTSDLSISADGRYVGFVQPDVNLSANCLRGYRYDRITRATINLTLSSTGVSPSCDPLSSSRNVTRVLLSGDGNQAAMETNYPELGIAGGGPNGAFRWVVVRDVLAGTTEPLSFTGIGFNNVFLQGFSDNGRYVLVVREANSVVLRMDRGVANTTLTIPLTRTGVVAFSGDGRAVLVGTATGVKLWRASGVADLVASTSTFVGTLNRDGSVVAIESTVPPATTTGNGFTDVYRFEIASSASYTVSAAMSLASATTPPAATAIPIADIPVDVIAGTSLPLAAAPPGGKSVAPHPAARAWHLPAVRAWRPLAARASPHPAARAWHPPAARAPRRSAARAWPRSPGCRLFATCPLRCSPSTADGRPSWPALPSPGGRCRPSRSAW